MDRGERLRQSGVTNSGSHIKPPSQPQPAVTPVEDSPSTCNDTVDTCRSPSTESTDSNAQVRSDASSDRQCTSDTQINCQQVEEVDNTDARTAKGAIQGSEVVSSDQETEDGIAVNGVLHAGCQGVGLDGDQKSCNSTTESMQGSEKSEQEADMANSKMEQKENTKQFTLDMSDDDAVVSPVANGKLEMNVLPTVKYEMADSAHDNEEKEDEDGSSRGCCGRRKKPDVPQMRQVGTFELFRYAGKPDILLMIIGTLGAMVGGCAIPINMVVYGQVINLFVFSAMGNNGTTTNGTTPDYSNLFEKMVPFALYFCYIGIGSLIANYFSVACWSWTAERQCRRIRKEYFRSIIKQDMAWYDTHETGELNSRFSEDMHNVQEGMGDKVAVFLQWITTWIAAYVMALTQGWKLALATMAFSPIVILSGAITMKLVRGTAAQELQAYAKAGAVAEESLRAIRTVHAFQGQDKESKRYDDNLVYAKKLATKKGLFLGLGTSSFWVIIFFAFALALWYGIRLVQTENLPPGNILPIFIGVLVGSMSLGHAFPNLESFANARGAAAKVYDIIDHRPIIDTSSPHGKKLNKPEGLVEFKNIHFKYPARPDIPILKGLNLTVQPSQTVALVGPSGCGKSTTVQLLQRFYDPEEGQVLVDGDDIRNLNLVSLREHIGVVSQEPVLFATSIAENIRFGKIDATQGEIERAAKDANCHDFITELPKGYETVIGERGAQLSGGQKQRIAIARALVRNPKILLLDEATSALDQESEALVQRALEKAEVGRTTIVIAHRLSTVKNANVIACISEGEIVEQGTYDQLIASEGLFYQLVKLQTHVAENTEEDVDDVEIVESDDDLDDTCDKEEADVILRSRFERSGSARSLTVRSSFHRRSARLSAVDKKKKGKNKGKDKENKGEVPQVSLKRILRTNAPEWVFILMGCVTSVIAGCVHPAFAFIMSEFIRLFSLQDREEQSRLTSLLCGVMVAIGAGVAIVRLFQMFSFTKAGTYLTARMRSMAFKSIIQQDMEFFDDSRNQVSMLTTRLSSDAALVQGAAGVKIGNVLESFATLSASIIIAFIYGWKLTLVVLAFMPIMIAAGIMQGKVMAGFAKSDKEHLENAGKLSSEAIDNIRTVASLTREGTFIQRFEAAIDAIYKTGRKRAQVFGVTYALAQCIIFFAYATAFVYGAYLVQTGEMDFFEVFRVFAAIIFGGMSVGRQSSFAPDYTKGKMAAGRLFAVIDRKPKINASSESGVKLDNFNGELESKSVTFTYASRPNIQVLNGLSVKVSPGETLALVGSSGCGKSTTVQMIERFYDPDTGLVTADNCDLRDLNLKWFRSQIGLVSQEPTLFDCSIAENIAYGDTSRVVPMNEIIEAARKANIHEFVSSLPQGYDTNVGDKGTQLSGGQKQRIAIARALLRNPKILLLDEATSALDSESERIVQEALDKARAGRTCVVIAHRLSTVKNADKIAVIHHGSVLEIGTHSELLAKKGAYYRLTEAQNRPRGSTAQKL